MSVITWKKYCRVSVVILMNRKPKAILEGILFALGESVSVKRLSEVTDLPMGEIKKVLEEMEEEYKNNPESGIHLIRLEDSYQLCTKREYYDYIHRIKEKNRRNALTNAGLEVLSVVAYNQPVTRSAIEFIRGVNSDGPLSKLVATGLVEEVGRLDAPGRPILFGTTEDFLRCFNLSSLSELPDVEKEYSFDGLKDEIGAANVVMDETNENQMQMPGFKIQKSDRQNDKTQENE